MTTDAPPPEIASQLEAAARAHRRAKVRLEATRAALYDAIRSASAAGQSVRTIAAAAEVSIGMVQDAIAGAKDGG